MDRSFDSRKPKRLVFLCLIGTLTGCVTNPTPVPTVWDRLGVTGGVARLRDATINRNGNFPGLEKKPPVLRIGDPANLAEGKPEVVKTAAKIKQEQDMKKQKLKAIKFLAEVGCGCYNKDDQVAKALLEALGDCDPDVKKAAIEAISKNAAACAKCGNGCEVTCCNADIAKKLEEMAVGIDDKGCPKEPDQEIRAAAMAALKRCGCPPEKAPEEIPTPPEIEEVPGPSEAPLIETPNESMPKIETPSAAAPSPRPTDKSPVSKVSFSLTESKHVTQIKPVEESPLQVAAAVRKSAASTESFGDGTEPVRLAHRKSKAGDFISGIANADQLVEAEVASVGTMRRGLDIVMPEVYELLPDQQLVLVDTAGNIQVGTIKRVDGKRVSVGFNEAPALKTGRGEWVRVGLMN
ncbi:MAG: hypothetical protein ACK553_12215 [Planctomycetota bacterium]|jgi:hypothetical protein